MKARARHRSHSVEFRRQVAQEFLAGEALHGLAQRHDVSRILIRIWVEKYEAGAFDEDARAADLSQAYEARIAIRAPPRERPKPNGWVRIQSATGSVSHRWLQNGKRAIFSAAALRRRRAASAPRRGGR